MQNKIWDRDENNSTNTNTGFNLTFSEEEKSDINKTQNLTGTAVNQTGKSRNMTGENSYTN